MIDTSSRPIPEVTLETLAKSFFRDALYYGFRKLDYVRFVNCLLDVMMNNTIKLDRSAEKEVPGDHSGLSYKVGQLPIEGYEVALVKLDYQKARDELSRWFPDGMKHRVFQSAAAGGKGSNMSSEELSHATFAQVNTRRNSRSVGLVAYVDYDSIHRKAELLVCFYGDGEEKKAIKEEAIMLWLTFGIMVLGLRKIYTHALSTDSNTIILNEELGFRVEGILKNEVIYENQYYDILRMGLFAKEQDYRADTV